MQVLTTISFFFLFFLIIDYGTSFLCLFLFLAIWISSRGEYQYTSPVDQVISFNNCHMSWELYFACHVIMLHSASAVSPPFSLSSPTFCSSSCSPFPSPLFAILLSCYLDLEQVTWAQNKLSSPQTSYMTSRLIQEHGKISYHSKRDAAAQIGVFSDRIIRHYVENFIYTCGRGFW